MVPGEQQTRWLTIGTGVGGGIAIGGRLHLGIDGTAGEVGHMTIDPHGSPCDCGNRGCLETFASGPSIATQGMRAALTGMPTQIGALVNHDLNQIAPEIILQAADAGDQVAREILERAGAVSMGQTICARRRMMRSIWRCATRTMPVSILSAMARCAGWDSLPPRSTAI